MDLEVELNYNLNFYEDEQSHIKRVFEETTNLKTRKNESNFFYPQKELQVICEKIEIEENKFHDYFDDTKLIASALEDSDELSSKNTDKVVCNICGKQVKNKIGLLRHELLMHSERSGKKRKKITKPYQCYICLKRFISEEKTETHLDEVHEVKSNYSSKTNKNVHVKRKEEIAVTDSSVTCGVCFKVFTTKKKLAAHLRVVHVSEKRFICPVCSKRFPTGAKLKIHTNIHYQHSVKVCDVCQKVVLNNTDLNKHKEIHNPNRIRNYKCPVCSKAYYTNESLIIHKRKHSGIKNHQCDICQKKFLFKNLLSIHMRTHEDKNKNKRFKCSYCTVKCTTKGNLNRHLMLHTETTKHECKICFKKFSFASNMKIHLKIHTNRVKNKICNICDRGFYDDKLLNLHLRVHTQGEKTYNCSQCSQKFTLNKYLLQHMRRVHKEKRFHCTHCDKTYGNQLKLQAHIDIHHIQQNIKKIKNSKKSKVHGKKK